MLPLVWYGTRNEKVPPHKITISIAPPFTRLTKYYTALNVSQLRMCYPNWPLKFNREGEDTSITLRCSCKSLFKPYVLGYLTRRGMTAKQASQTHFLLLITLTFLLGFMFAGYLYWYQSVAVNDFVKLGVDQLEKRAPHSLRNRYGK